MRLKTVPGFTRLSVIVCCCAIVLAACGSGNPLPAGKNTGNQPVAAPPDKQIVRMPAEGGDFATLDPALTALTGEPMNIIFTGLVGLKADGTVGDQLAASHEVSADGLTYTFKLKPNLKFSDGSPLTADDVAYSINRAVSPATKSNVRTYLNMLKDFDKITSGKIPTLIGDSLIVKDPSTISIVLSKPAAYFLQALTYPTSYVVQRKLIEQYGDKWTDHLNEGGGAGPFKVESYSHTTGLVLVPNPNYYGPKPKLQKIQYIIAGDRDSNYRALRAGQYDIALVPPSQIEFASKQAGFQSIPSLTTNYIGLNYLAKPFDNIKIRQAFALAIDKELIAKRIIGNASIPRNHIVLKGMAGYNENLTGPTGVTSLAGDQAKAKQLFQEGLQEAGYGSVDKLPPLSLAYTVSYLVRRFISISGECIRVI
ncbi:MAG: peptide ABC transporter substrate-binding protein [Ktedonobacteraceae bacterium]|nr:peptide ABC transporter substrate-binding protein [Ktedonobacteraceae bacterium]